MDYSKPKTPNTGLIRRLNYLLYLNEFAQQNASNQQLYSSI